MTIKELIDELSKWPPDMPVAVMHDISPVSKDMKNWIEVTEHTWVHGNYPYDKPNFQYVNLE